MPFLPPRPFENNIIPDVFDEEDFPLAEVENDLPVEVNPVQHPGFAQIEELINQPAQLDEWAFLGGAQNIIDPPIVGNLVFNQASNYSYSWGAKKKEVTPFTEILDHLKGEATRWLHTGSRVICDPPVLNTDDDYLFLVPQEHFDTHCDYLQAQNFEVGGSRSPQDHTNTFVSYKRRTDGETLNVMLTSNISHFWSFVDATALAKKLNLVRKEDRIALFEAVNRNVWPEIEVG